MDINTLLEEGKSLIIEYGVKLLGAVAVLIIGLWVIKAITNKLNRVFDKSKVNESLRPFLRGIINITLKVLLVVSVLGMMGIEMTSFIAILGAAGLAVGMALSGTLQNFAGGVMILIFKPFKVGDFIIAQGHSGTVKEIQIFNTILTTPDNKRIILPNGGLSTSSMTNISAEPTRRVDWTIGVAYGDDLEKTKELILGLCKGEDRILPDKEPVLVLTELADSSVNFSLRVWVNAGDYWPLYWEMNEKIYHVLTDNGINIPFPQMDVHLHKSE